MTIPAFEGSEPSLQHLFDMHVDLEAPQMIGQTPVGIRQVFIVKAGTFDGPKLKGKLLPGGGDWATLRPDGAVQLDVRATLKTDDGAVNVAARLLKKYLGEMCGRQKTFGAGARSRSRRARRRQLHGRSLSQ